MSVPAEDRRRATIFLAGSAALLAVVVAILASRRFAVEERTVFVLFRESVGGLAESSAVTYKGVPVGFVRDIELLPGQLEVVRVELGLRPEVRLKVDTRAQLRPQGITGASYLELQGGSATALDLPEGGAISAVPSLFSTAGTTLEDVASIAHELRGSGALVQATLEELRRTLVAVREGALVATDGVAAVRTDVQASIEDLRRATAALERAATGVAVIAEDNRGEVRALLQELRRATSDVRGLTRRVRDQPSSLVFDRRPAEKPFPDELPASHEEAR